MDDSEGGGLDVVEVLDDSSDGDSQSEGTLTLWPKFDASLKVPQAGVKSRTMLEMFSPPRMVPYFEAGGGGGLSKDLATGWNALRWED
eukprot:1477483-Karenia_brevis.AAC.1